MITVYFLFFFRKWRQKVNITHWHFGNLLLFSFSSVNRDYILSKNELSTWVTFHPVLLAIQLMLLFQFYYYIFQHQFFLYLFCSENCANKAEA